MPLEVNPIPDTIIRLLMEYKPLNKPIKIEEQKLMTPERTGFTLVEWGGSLIKKSSIIELFFYACYIRGNRG